MTASRRIPIAVTSILLIITIQSYSQAGTIETGFAESPSFVRQEVIDDSGDWIFWKGSSSNKIQLNTHDNNMFEVDRAHNASECEIDENQIPPDIQSVSYVSDGKNLSAIVWLSSQFEEPPLNYTVDTFQEELMVTISDTDLNLEDYTIQNMARLPLHEPEFRVQENSTKKLAGKIAHEISYTNTTSQGEPRVTRIWTIDADAGKAYEITYTALPSTYQRFLPTIQEMINTFEIIPSPSSSSRSTETSLNRNTSDTSKDFLPYQTSEIRIRYPPDWQYQNWTNREDNARTVHFRSPFEDSQFEIPSWREVTFTMAIDIDSVLDAGTDYRVIYSRVPHNTWTGYWTKQVREISAFDKIRVAEENKNYTDFYNKQDKSHVLFSFDLSKVNSPERYKAAFYINNYFVKGHQFCTLIDTTNWVIIPPPEFTMSTDPSSVVLRPGEEQNIQLQVKGNSDLQAEALLTAGNNDISNDVKIDIFPSNKTSIPASGSGAYSLHIKANATAEPRTYTFPITANISFPTSITNRGGETFNNNKSVSIIESSNLTLTVLPPYTTPELLTNFTSAWITPITGIWTFIAGVGAVVAPMLLYLYRKRKEKRQQKEG